MAAGNVFKTAPAACCLLAPAFRQSRLAFDGLDVEVLDEPDDVLPDLVVVEAALRHLADGFFLAPAADYHAVNGAHHSCALGAAIAVHQHRLAVLVGGDLQEANRLCLFRALGFDGDLFEVDVGACQELRIPPQ